MVTDDGFRNALLEVLSQYPRALGENFADHPTARAVRALASPLQLESGNEFVVKAGAGQGRWAETPWVAIMHPAITTSPMSGVYVVYLIRGDGSGIYLSLNQGITAVRERSESFIEALRRQASLYRHQLKTHGKLNDEALALSLRARGIRSRAYEAAAICARFYSTEAMPGQDQLRSDLRLYLSGYLSLV